ncbi:butyrophilin subfamily 1 member A1-like [Odontesthes bonariensis]
MYYRLFLLVGLLSHKGDSSGRAERVVAFAGGDVILPCSFRNAASNAMDDVEWSKRGLAPDVVFLYRDGSETFEMKNPDFEFRTNLFMREVKNGNVSLRISNVKLSDAGEYRCLRLPKNAPRETTAVELVVVAVSEPTLSVVSSAGGAVTVQCEASCWLPAPQMKLLDDGGNHVVSEEPKRERDAGGCYTTRQRVTIQSPTSRLVCRVDQLEFNQSRTTDILIPAACTKSDFPLIIAAAGTLLVCFVGAGLAVFCWINHKPARGKRTSDQSTRSDGSEDQSLLEPPRMTCTADSEPTEESSTNHRLQPNEWLQRHRVVCQANRPTIVQSYTETRSRSLDFSTKDSNSPSEHNPKQTASTIGNPSGTFNLAHKKGLKLEIQGQNSDLAGGQTLHRYRRSNSSPVQSALATSGHFFLARSAAIRQDSKHPKSDNCSLLDQGHDLSQRRHSLRLPVDLTQEFGAVFYRQMT